jgi:hypothetical protein
MHYTGSSPIRLSIDFYVPCYSWTSVSHCTRRRKVYLLATRLLPEPRSNNCMSVLVCAATGTGMAAAHYSIAPSAALKATNHNDRDHTIVKCVKVHVARLVVYIVPRGYRGGTILLKLHSEKLV